MPYTFSMSKISILTIENAYVYVNDIYCTLLRNIETSYMSLCPNKYSDDTYETGIYMYKPGPSCSKLTTSLVNDSLKFT